MLAPVFSPRYGGRTIDAQILAMGTLVGIRVIVTRGHEHAARTAIHEIEQQLHSFGRDAWAWGKGALARFNASLMLGQRAAVPTMLQPLFRRAWQLHQLSGGRFEPRIGHLVACWGFDDVEHLRTAPPDSAQIDQCLRDLRAAPAFSDATSYGPAPGVAWDFGGIGKGYIVDRALAHLFARGFRHASIDAGGNLAVRGRHKHRRWRAGIRDPRSENATAPRLLAQLEIEDEAVITHGDDQRGFTHEHRRYGHLLDPLTGWPAQGLRSLTVVHPDASFADAAGGALYVAGPRHWPALARQMGIDQVLALDDNGQLTATRALAARLQLAPGMGPLIVAGSSRG